MAWNYHEGAPDPIDLAEGERRRDEGHEAVIDPEAEWVRNFEATLASLIRRGRKRITSSDVLEHVGLPPGHRNAVGAIMRACAVRHNLRNIGTIKSARVARHAGRITVWEVQ